MLSRSAHLARLQLLPNSSFNQLHQCRRHLSQPDDTSFGTSQPLRISYSSNNGANQRWFVIPLVKGPYPGTPTGQYAIISGSSANYMSTVQTSPSVSPPFSNLQLNGTQDLFTITSGTQTGAYYINSVSMSGLVLDLENGSTAIATPIILQTLASPATTSQQWTFTAA